MVTTPATGKDVVVVTVPDTAPGRFYDANMVCRAEAGLLVCTPPA